MVEGGLKDYEVDERKAKRSKSDDVKDDSNEAVVLSDPEDAQDKRKAVVDVDMDQRCICIYKVTLNARDELLLLENHELNDKHIAKCITKIAFTSISFISRIKKFSSTRPYLILDKQLHSDISLSFMSLDYCEYHWMPTWDHQHAH